MYMSIVSSFIRSSMYNRLNSVNTEESSLFYRGLTGKTSFIVLFINQKIVTLGDELISLGVKNNISFRNSKRFVSKLERLLNTYTVSLNCLVKFNHESYNESLSIYNKDTEKYLVMYRNTVSQMLLDHGIDGYRNKVSSIVLEMLMLSQVARWLLQDLQDTIYEKFALREKWMWGIEITGVKSLLTKLSSDFTEGSDEFDVNEEPNVIKAYNNLIRVLVGNDLFKKAMKDNEDFKEFI